MARASTAISIGRAQQAARRLLGPNPKSLKRSLLPELGTGERFAADCFLRQSALLSPPCSAPSAHDPTYIGRARRAAATYSWPVHAVVGSDLASATTVLWPVRVTPRTRENARDRLSCSIRQECAIVSGPVEAAGAAIAVPVSAPRIVARWRNFLGLRRSVSRES